MLENNDKFISKQYGFITDTSIGSNSTESTADYLIDSFNNTYNENYQCDYLQKGGGIPIDLSLFPDNLKQNIKSINISDFKNSRNDIQEVYKDLINNENPNLIEVFTNALKEKFKDKETFINNKKEIININNTIDEYKNNEINSINKENSNKNLNFEKSLLNASFIKPSNDTSTISYNDVNKEDNNNIFTKMNNLDEITNKTTQVDSYKLTSDEIKSFNNEENVETIFNIKSEVIKESEKNPFVKINANSMINDIDFYEDTNANNLQLYYDYINLNPNTNSSLPNYFNNCWQSTNFYQKGGSNYPYKFTITSGSLDSSGLGGQSLPPYHAPEVDIYMPIFELSGNESLLKGAIIRMVILKEVLNNNPINSKSKVVVFCHFVYADFESCGIENPINIDSYENSLQQLLTFVINNTFYINRETENNCVNIDNLKMNDLNKDENLNFILKLSNGKLRLWYKYFSYTQGPTVKDSIVKPVNFNSINQMKTVTKSDYVALGIVDVAEHLIDNSSKLRDAFNDKKVLFVKLFLVRNKYTGDKSRATDTLFLNQNSYLEGVQISNDENTLYNAQMLGLNTVWSTSTKSVFYMAPYLTKQNKIPITTGQFVEKLCKGLKSNPYLNTILNKKESNENSNEESLIKSEILENLYSNFSKEFLDYYELYNKENKVKVDILKSINYNLTDSIFNYTEKLNNDMNKFLDLSNYYEAIIGTYNCVDTNEMEIENNNENNNEKIFNNTFNSTKSQNKYPEYFQNRYENIIETLNSLNGKNIIKTYNLIFEFIKLVNVMKNKFNNIKNINIILNDNLQNFIVYVLKIIPYWMDEIINYKKSIVMYEYCNTNNIIIKKIDEFISIYESNELCKSFLNDLKVKISTKFFQFQIKQKIDVNCSNKPIEDKNYLKEYEPNKTDDINDEEVQLKKINENQEKYNIFAKNLIESSNLADTIKKNKNALTSTSTPSLFTSINRDKKNKFTPEYEDIISSKKPYITNTNISIGGNNDIVKKEEKTDFQNKLEEFYKNTYKCNVGNQIKYFISIIKEIEDLYGNYGNKEIENLEGENSLLLINIFMKNINFINSSYVPIINYNNIIDKFELVDLNYTVEEMNCLLNQYSSQLQMYSLINDIKNSEYSKEELSNLLYDSISDVTLKDLNIPFFKYEIQKKIMFNTLEPIDFSENLDIENNNLESNEISELNNDTKNLDAENNEISESNNNMKTLDAQNNDISELNNNMKSLDIESNNEISELNNDTEINRNDSNKDISNYLNKFNKTQKKPFILLNNTNGIRTRTGGINFSYKNKKINKNKKTRKSRKKIMNKRTKRKLFVKRKKYSKKNK